MNLTDRLAAAARARGETARARPVTTEADTAADPDVAAPVDDTRVQIVMGASTPVAAVPPDPAAAPDAVCPTCGRTGEIGIVDMARRTADWSCAGCGTMWRIRMPAPVDGELAPPLR